MKATLTTIFFALVVSSSWAEYFTVDDEIVALRSHADYWSKNSWIQLKGVTGVDNCPQGSSAGLGTLTYLIIPEAEKNMYSMALAAKLSGAKVQLQYSNDEAEKVNGFCSVRYITLK